MNISDQKSLVQCANDSLMMYSALVQPSTEAITHVNKNMFNTHHRLRVIN